MCNNFFFFFSEIFTKSIFEYGVVMLFNNLASNYHIKTTIRDFRPENIKSYVNTQFHPKFMFVSIHFDMFMSKPSHLQYSTCIIIVVI